MKSGVPVNQICNWCMQVESFSRRQREMVSLEMGENSTQRYFLCTVKRVFKDTSKSVWENCHKNGMSLKTKVKILDCNGLTCTEMDSDSCPRLGPCTKNGYCGHLETGICPLLYATWIFPSWYNPKGIPLNRDPNLSPYVWISHKLWSKAVEMQVPVLSSKYMSEKPTINESLGI